MRPGSAPARLRRSTRCDRTRNDPNRSCSPRSHRSALNRTGRGTGGIAIAVGVSAQRSKSCAHANAIASSSTDLPDPGIPTISSGR